MIKLNLLPEKVRAAALMRLIIVLGVVVYILGLLGLGFRYTQARARYNEVQHEVDAVNAELNSPALISTVQAVEKFTQDKADEQAKASVVESYRRKQVTLARLLDSLPDWTESGQVWFDHILADADKGTVTLEGDSMDPLAFARFYTLLGSQPIVTKLAMPDKGTMATVRGYSVMHFKVTFSVEVPQ
jgi:Tfp pilus assembly protein PilN